MPRVNLMINFKIPSVGPTAYYVPDFITKIEEEYLVHSIKTSPKPKWTQLSHRRLQNWGGLPHKKGMIAESIPPWLHLCLDEVDALNLMDGNKPNHVLVNEYLPGQGIMPHVDGPLFYPTISTISLSSHAVLKFWEPTATPEVVSLQPVFSFLLEPRSLLVLQDKLFSHYMHSIDEIKEDVVNKSLANLCFCAEEYQEGTILKRDTRYSLTIRHVPNTTSFKLGVGFKML